MKVYISPSDQWSNEVADKEHSEAYHCKQIAEQLKKYLVYNGYDVRIGDNSKEKTYSTRVKDSNNWGADLHICIHTNAGGGQGTLMMCYPKSEENKYVKNIYNEVANLTPTKDKGIMSTKNLYEINKTKCVCAYLEVDFHDNPTIENWIDDNIDAIAKAIAKGICVADNKSFNSETQSSKLYRVQCGAFKDKSNALNLVAELNKKGFDCFIVEV